MADEPDQTPKKEPGVGAADRPRRRGATIDLTATDITPKDQSATTAVPESDAAVQAPEVTVPPAAAAEIKPERSVMPAEAEAPSVAQLAPEPVPAAAPVPPARPAVAVPAAVAIVVGALSGLAGAAIAPRLFPTAPAPSPVAAAPPSVELPPALAQLPERMTAVERRVGEIGADLVTVARADALAAAGGRIDAAEKALGERIAALEAALAAANRRLDGLAAIPAGTAPPPATAPIDLAPLAERLDRMEKGLGDALKGVGDALQRADAATGAAGALSAPVAAATAGLAALGTTVAAIEPRIAELAGRVETISRRIESGASAPVYTVVQALSAAFNRGQPYASELQALSALKLPAPALEPLMPFAERGAPTAAQLVAEFRPLASRIASAGADAGGVWGVIGSIVQVRPTGDVPGTAPAALAARIERALGAGDLAAALAAWRQLPAPLQGLAPAFGQRLAQREAAGTALAVLERDTLAAIRGATQ